MRYPPFIPQQEGLSPAAGDRVGSLKAEEIQTLGKNDNPAKYFFSEELVHAINVALVLGMPLLVTGEPGTGKTDLGRALAHEIGAGNALKFETKSTSQAKDLFYTFDVIGRFGARDIESASRDPRDYIAYHALGRAILSAFPKETVAHLLSPAQAERHAGPKRSVVIIDEIDKAPRDFPNDLLNEIDRMAFRVPELHNAATPGIDGGEGVPHNLRPIVVITSNSEKGLPDPFLRRCVYVDIAFPDTEQLKRIVSARLEDLTGGCNLVTDALALFTELRKPAGRASLNKRPATAELLNWLQMLRVRGFTADDRLKTASAQDRLINVLPALIKNRDDRETATRFIGDWCKSEGA
jgi:MoxR-like ATPase